MKFGAVLLVAACCALFVPPVSADVRISFAGGRVSIAADGATIPEILAEWARVGGSTFVDAEKIPAADRLTLRIEDRDEVEALDVLLRSVAGYMVAPIEPSPENASTIARVFILPTSTPAPYTPPPPPADPMPQASESPLTMRAGPPQPDDDGPVRVVTPPAADAAQQAPAAQQTPAGQNSPLTSSTQTVPGLGVVTSSQPGVAIDPDQRRSRRPVAQPTRPRPGGGGGR